MITIANRPDNGTEFGIDLMQYQYFFPIDKIGVGLCPLGCGHVQPSPHCIASRIAAAEKYGAKELDIWALWDSTASNWSVVEEAWRPWVKPLRAFLSGVDPSPQEGSPGTTGEPQLCWNSSAERATQQ